jgi:hypothetical protein
VAKEVMFVGDQISKQPQALYEKMLKPIADRCDTDIIVTICHGRYEVVPQEMSFDKLYIFVQLLPKEFEGVKKSTVKGYKIDGEDLVFPVKVDATNPLVSPCPQGDSLVYTKAPSRAIIINDDLGVPMAAILDGSLYIMNDFIHSRSKADFEAGAKQLEFILAKSVAMGLVESIKCGQEEKSKRSLESALRVQFSQRLEKELVQLKAARDTVIQYEKGITDATRKIVSTEKIVEAIRNNIEDVPKALDKTWASLKRMDGSKTYSSVSYTKTGIKAITVPIVIKWNGKEYDMGRFEVSLGYDGTCKILNLDHRIEHLDHPHISNTAVCWGNFSGWIPKLIGSSEFDVALDQIYTFLCHYDSGSPYRSIESWPVVKKVKEVKVEEEKLEII